MSGTFLPIDGLGRIAATMSPKKDNPEVKRILRSERGKLTRTELLGPDHILIIYIICYKIFQYQSSILNFGVPSLMGTSVQFLKPF